MTLPPRVAVLKGDISDFARSQDQAAAKAKSSQDQIAKATDRARDAQGRFTKSTDAATKAAQEHAAKWGTAGYKVKQAGGYFDRTGKGAVTLGSRFKGATAAVDELGLSTANTGTIAAGAGLVAAAFWKSAFQEAREAAKVGRQTEAVIRSTGGAAGVTAGQVADLAGAISNKVGVDDEAIQSGANLLLTFTKVRNEAGKGNDVFSQATTTIVDMTAAMNQGEVTAEGLKASTIQVGKALNDPIRGMTALTKVGVTFTAGQKQQIAALVASGNTMEAQKIILRELQTEFGGSAAASADAGQKMSVAFGNVKETLGAGMLPAVELAAAGLGKLAGAFQVAEERSDGLASKAAILGGPIAFVTGMWRSGKQVLDGLSGSQKEAAVSGQQVATAHGAAAVAAAKNEEHHKKLVGKVHDVKQAFYQERQAVSSVIPMFEGYKAKSGITKDKILSNLRQEVGAYKTWAKDAQTLLRRGADPSVVAALSKKGPEYVHAFVNASDKELAGLSKSMRSRIQAAGQIAKIQGRVMGQQIGDALESAIERAFHPSLSMPSVRNPAAGIKGGGSVHGAVGKIGGGSGKKNYRAQGGLLSEPIIGIGLKSGEEWHLAERGPEMVVPLGGAGRGGGGGGAAVVHVHVAGSVLAERELLEIVQRQAARYNRRNAVTGLAS